MLSPVYKHPADGDPFAPGNFPDHLADAVMRSDVELGPMPGADQLEAFAAGEHDYSAGAERLWWRPTTGALFTTRAGGTLIADHLGRTGHRVTGPDRHAAIYDICYGLSGMRRWTGRATVCVARHSLVCAAMASASAAGSTLPRRWALTCLLGGHDMDEALGTNDPATPVGRLADGLMLEHRRRATAACFRLVGAMPPEEVTHEVMAWAAQIDQLAAVMEYAWDFGRPPPWLDLTSREVSFVGYVLEERQGRLDLEGTPGPRARSVPFSEAAVEALAELLCDGKPSDHPAIRDRRARFLERTLPEVVRRDPFGAAVLKAWDQLGPIREPVG